MCLLLNTSPCYLRVLPREAGIPVCQYRLLKSVAGMNPGEAIRLLSEPVDKTHEYPQSDNVNLLERSVCRHTDFLSLIPDSLHPLKPSHFHPRCLCPLCLCVIVWVCVCHCVWVCVRLCVSMFVDIRLGQCVLSHFRAPILIGMK